MKILFIRHAEPDYVNDSLTEKGFKEAELLGSYLSKKYPHIDEFYVSKFGRAQRTFDGTKGYYPDSPYHICDWLVEFQGKASRPDKGTMASCWDQLPEVMNRYPELYSSDRWKDSSFLKIDGTTVLEEYGKVITEFDKVLAEHGYVRNGVSYDAIENNHQVIAFYCHYGVASALMSHLMNCSPYSLWENIVLLPSSLTEFVSEERRKGKASFRADKIGSLAHLDLADEDESFAARFCECFEDETRHD